MRLGGFALWFLNFSTWLGTHGLYLEDLYVRPELRGTGYGKRLLGTLAQECVDNGYGRLEWWVLDWNEPALGFYGESGRRAHGRVDGAPRHRRGSETARRRGGRDRRGEGLTMGDRVSLIFRAATRNAALARTVAAAMAARADLPLDQLEDVRLAVDEAVSQLILDAPDACRRRVRLHGRGAAAARPRLRPQPVGPGARPRHVQLDRAHRTRRRGDGDGRGWRGDSRPAHRRARYRWTRDHCAGRAAPEPLGGRAASSRGRVLLAELAELAADDPAQGAGPRRARHHAPAPRPAPGTSLPRPRRAVRRPRAGRNRSA